MPNNDSCETFVFPSSHQKETSTTQAELEPEVSSVNFGPSPSSESIESQTSASDLAKSLLQVDISSEIIVATVVQNILDTVERQVDSKPVIPPVSNSFDKKPPSPEPIMWNSHVSNSSNEFFDSFGLPDATTREGQSRTHHTTPVQVSTQAFNSPAQNREVNPAPFQTSSQVLGTSARLFQPPRFEVLPQQVGNNEENPAIQFPSNAAAQFFIPQSNTNSFETWNTETAAPKYLQNIEDEQASKNAPGEFFVPQTNTNSFVLSNTGTAAPNTSRISRMNKHLGMLQESSLYLKPIPTALSYQTQELLPNTSRISRMNKHRRMLQESSLYLKLTVLSQTQCLLRRSTHSVSLHHNKR